MITEDELVVLRYLREGSGIADIVGENKRLKAVLDAARELLSSFHEGEDGWDARTKLRYAVAAFDKGGV